MIATADEPNRKPRFPLGRVVATPGALEAMREAGDSATDFLRRHERGDWGHLDPEDLAENEYSLEKNLRLLSAYQTSLGERIWVLTEGDRTATTILLPSEY